MRAAFLAGGIIAGAAGLGLAWLLQPAPQEAPMKIVAAAAPAVAPARPLALTEPAAVSLPAPAIEPQLVAAPAVVAPHPTAALPPGLRAEDVEVSPAGIVSAVRSPVGGPVTAPDGPAYGAAALPNRPVTVWRSP